MFLNNMTKAQAIDWMRNSAEFQTKDLNGTTINYVEMNPEFAKSLIRSLVGFIGGSLPKQRDSKTVYLDSANGFTYSVFHGRKGIYELRKDPI